MSTTREPRQRLNEMPIGQLQALRDQAEREFGPDDPTTRVLARLVRDRLRGEGGGPRRIAAGAAR